jgi:hypothetical protein
MLDRTVNAPGVQSAAASTPSPSRRHVIANALIFNLLWAVTIIGAANFMPWLGVAAAAAMLAGHLWTMTHRHRELRLVLLTTAIGFGSDSVLAATGVLQYSSGVIAAWLAPIWILSLWVAFATTLNVSFRWLQGRPWLAMLLGAISGPMSYYAGSRMGAVTMPDPSLALISLSVAWAILMPVLLILARRIGVDTQAMDKEVSHA